MTLLEITEAIQKRSEDRTALLQYIEAFRPVVFGIIRQYGGELRPYLDMEDVQQQLFTKAIDMAHTNFKPGEFESDDAWKRYVGRALQNEFFDLAKHDPHEAPGRVEEYTTPTGENIIEQTFADVKENVEKALESQNADEIIQRVWDELNAEAQSGDETRVLARDVFGWIIEGLPEGTTRENIRKRLESSDPQGRTRRRKLLTVVEYIKQKLAEAGYVVAE